MIRPYLTREAVLSSKIEGTQATIIDIFQFDVGEVDEEEKETKRVIEVVNYMSSLQQCLNDVKKGKPINLDMIIKAHKILLHKVRGQQLNPGEIRTEQNWIGIEVIRWMWVIEIRYLYVSSINRISCSCFSNFFGSNICN